MATQLNITSADNRERLAGVSEKACYLETLLVAIERAFEETNHDCDALPAGARDQIRGTTHHGLTLTHKAQDKARAIRELVD